MSNNCKQVGTLKGTKWDRYRSTAKVYSTTGLCPTLNTCGGGNTEMKILIGEATRKGYAEAEVGDSINIAFAKSKTRKGRVGKGIAHTLVSNNLEELAVSRSGVRKLTPKEYWRLMGFTDEDFEKAEKVCSNTQLYKQAGNSIVVPVLEAIFSELLKDDSYEK